MGFLNRIKLRIARKKIQFKRKLNPPYIPTEKESKVIYIVKSLIRDESSIMLIAPISGKKYIKNETRGMFVIIDDVNITLSSSKSMFYYNIIIHENVFKKISRNYDNVLESRRNKMEKETISGVTSSLDFIASHINDYKIKNTSNI